jgi:hypothetical protein
LLYLIHFVTMKPFSIIEKRKIMPIEVKNF